jgi:hypothetical protein
MIKDASQAIIFSKFFHDPLYRWAKNAFSPIRIKTLQILKKNRFAVLQGMQTWH